LRKQFPEKKDWSASGLPAIERRISSAVMSEVALPKPNPLRAAKFALFVFFVVALLSLPFVFFGEEYVAPILGNHEQQAWVLAGIGVILLTADSLAPVPSSIVIVAVALKAGWAIGTLAGTVGLCGQVVGAAWFGKLALSKITLRMLGLADGEQLRATMQKRLAVTLGCLRSVPLLAETSVVVAASLGVSLRQIFRVTVLPNLAIAATYSLAAQAGLWVAGVAVVVSTVVSVVLWRVTIRRAGT
jgi:hypothetical protein